MELALNNVDTVVVKSGGFGGLRNLSPAQKALLLGCFLSLLQALDGILTSLGVSRFGVAIEGNPFIRGLMEEFGHVTALSVVKCLAIVVVIGLAYFGRKMPWVNNAMGAVSAVYVFGAIIPWTYILFVKPYLG